jgi:hypothetical protein
MESQPLCVALSFPPFCQLLTNLGEATHFPSTLQGPTTAGGLLRHSKCHYPSDAPACFLGSVTPFQTDISSDHWIFSVSYQHFSLLVINLLLLSSQL